MASYSSTLTIEEIETRKGLRPRVVILRGPSLPFRGAEWPGEQGMSTTWYPGNIEGSQQVLGPREMPSKWTGEWNRTRISRTPATFRDSFGGNTQVVDPKVLWDALEGIYRSGLRLRVTWAVSGDAPGSNGRVVREGRAKSWTFKADRIQDIAWEVQFDWVSRGATQQRSAPTRDGSIATGSAQLDAAVLKFVILAQLKKFQASNALIRRSATEVTLGQLERLADAPQKLVSDVTRTLRRTVNDVQRTADIAKKIGTSPLAIANTALDFARNTVAVVNQFIDEVGRMPWEVAATGNKADDLLRSVDHFGGLQDQAELVAQRSQELDARVRQQAHPRGNTGTTNPRTRGAGEGDILAVHVVRAGETPQRLSVRYYGSPDHDVDILRANRLPEYQATIPPGKIVVIPVISTVAQGG